MPLMESFDGRKTSVREHERKTKSGKKTTVKKHDRTLRNKIMNDIERGIYRAEYGLETDSGSKYSRLREDGLSDAEAQYEVFKSRGLLPDKEMLDLENRLYELYDELELEKGFPDEVTKTRVNLAMESAKEFLDSGRIDEAKEMIASLNTYSKIVRPIELANMEEKEQIKSPSGEIIQPDSYEQAYELADALTDSGNLRSPEQLRTYLMNQGYDKKIVYDVMDAITLDEMLTPRDKNDIDEFEVPPYKKELEYKDFTPEQKEGIKKFSALSSKEMEKINKKYEDETGKRAGNIYNKGDFYKYANRNIKDIKTKKLTFFSPSNPKAREYVNRLRKNQDMELTGLRLAKEQINHIQGWKTWEVTHTTYSD